MMSRIKSLGLKVAAVSSAAFAALATRVLAVDPTLTNVTETFTTSVSSILVFVVAVIGAFIGAALIILGLKFVFGWIKKLLGMGR